MENELYFNTETLEKAFGISKDTQARYRSQKAIPFSKIGGFIWYKKKEIYEWIDNHAIKVVGSIDE